ncbi:MAG: hypothetical protein Q8J97_10910, partial [Flavobacteriaceae bacterium]|nr:hypothetical protein [Flavobacteriaceae bacterium]
VTRNGPPVYFQSHSFADAKDNDATRTFSFCIMIPVRPVIKLKGAVSGIRTLAWTSTLITTAGYRPPRNTAASARELTLDDDEEDDEERLRLRRVQNKTRDDRREEAVRETGLTHEEFDEAEREANIAAGADAVKDQPVRQARVNLLVAGDDEGRLLLWHLDEELAKRPQLTADSLRSTSTASAATDGFGSVPTTRSLSTASQRDFASQRLRRAGAHDTTSTVSGMPSLSAVTSAIAASRSTDKKIHFTGGVAIAGVAVVVPSVIRIAYPTGLVEHVDESTLPLTVAHMHVYRCLEFVVGLTDGSLQFLSCHPVEVGHESDAEAMTALDGRRSASPAGGVVQRGSAADTDVLGSLSMGTFSVFLQKRVLEYQPETLNHIWHDTARGHVWVSRGDGTLSVYDTKSLACLCRVPAPAAT